MTLDYLVSVLLFCSKKIYSLFKVVALLWTQTIEELKDNKSAHELCPWLFLLLSS